MKITGVLLTVLLLFSFAGVGSPGGAPLTQEIAEKSSEKSSGTNAGPDGKNSKNSKKEKKAKSSGTAGTNKAVPAAESR